MDLKLLLVFNLICGLRLGQTFPSLSFGGKNVIPNHGYVDLGMVGTTYSNSVWCRTDLTTCCRSSEGTYRGQWYFPDGQHLQAIGDIYEEEKPKRVDLRRNNSATISPTGIYHCEIPTIAVHDDTNISAGATVYVGLYTHGGKQLKGA